MPVRGGISGAKPSVPETRSEPSAADRPSVAGGVRRDDAAPIGMDAARAYPGPLPANYASGSIWLAARDSFRVLVHWDFSAEQLSVDAGGHGPGGWQVRLHQGAVGGRVVNRRGLPAPSGEMFLDVPVAGCAYVAELGYETVAGKWFGIAMSAPATTPSESGQALADSEPHAADYPDVAWGSIAPVASTDTENFGGAFEWMDVAGAVLGESDTMGTDFHGGSGTRSDGFEAVEPGFLRTHDLTRIVRRLLEGEAVGSSGESIETVVVEEIVTAGGRASRPGPNQVGVGDGGLPGAGPDAVPSSADLAAGADFGAGRRSFWFEVNAELVVYGRTEKDARVTVAGRPVALRDDGSFSFRFVLPDGEHAMPVVAVSSDGGDTRSAALRFSRATAREGLVGEHARDPALKPPGPEAIG